MPPIGDELASGSLPRFTPTVCWGSVWDATFDAPCVLPDWSTMSYESKEAKDPANAAKRTGLVELAGLRAFIETFRTR